MRTEDCGRKRSRSNDQLKQQKTRPPPSKNTKESKVYANNEGSSSRQPPSICTFKRGDLVWIKEWGKSEWSLGFIANICHPFELGSTTYN